MRGSAEVLEAVLKNNVGKKLNFPVLVPNERGMQDAIKSGAKEISIFTACSESFNKANINCAIEESFERFQPVMILAKKNKIKVRGYLSTAFYCPYEGKIKATKAVELTKRLLKIGCYEVSIGDTIGAANPKEVDDVLKKLKPEIKKNKIAVHFHDTRGTALANVLESLKHGVKTFDSSLGGLGGCPYAPGAQGNVSTEDVVYMLHGMGFKTGINLEKLIQVSRWMAEKMEKALPSRVGKAGMPKT
jgi:hydroxymethylglutaryl-CoA lyase